MSPLLIAPIPRGGSLAILAAALCLAASASAHEDPSDTAAALEARLGASPADASLLLHLGQVERESGDLPGARSHLVQALANDPELGAAELELARVLLAEGAAIPALSHVERYLATREDDSVALRLRARGLAAMDRTREAATDADRAASLDETRGRATAEGWLLAADALLAAGRGADAVARLDHAIERLGLVPALVERAAAIDVLAGRTGQAALRLDRAAAASAASAPWLLLEADLLAGVGDCDGSERALERAAVLDPDGRARARAR